MRHSFLAAVRLGFKRCCLSTSVWVVLAVLPVTTSYLVRCTGRNSNFSGDKLRRLHRHDSQRRPCDRHGLVGRTVTGDQRWPGFPEAGSIAIRAATETAATAAQPEVVSAAAVGEKKRSPRCRVGLGSPQPEDHSLKPAFAALEDALTREDFAHSAWLSSCEQLVSVAVSLASCAVPFTESRHLPPEHAAALSMVVRLTEKCRTSKSINGRDSGVREEKGEGGRGFPTGLASSLKYCTRKNGLGRAAAEVAEGVLPKYACIRDRATAIRGVERCLSEFCVAWSTARLLDAGAVSEIRRDFVFHLKALLEHAPACERHEAVLILCRGFFTPVAKQANDSSVENHVFDAAFVPAAGGQPLADSFAEVQNGAREFPKALRAARQAFPFLESLARWAWRCQAPLETNANAATAATAATVTAAAAAAAVTATAGQLEGMESQGHVEEGRGSASADQGHRNRRGREDTGVASLLVALASADPSGETIRSMQRWACEALLPEQVGEAPWSATGTAVDRNEVARCLLCTRETFVVWAEASHLRWAKSCRELGEVLRMLVGALDEEGVGGIELTSVVNHAMFVTTFLRSMSEGAKGRRGYERLIGSGHVPGHKMSFSAERGARERVKTWREAAEVLDLGMAAVLKVPEAKVRSKRFRAALSSVLRTWRAPHALADFYIMQQKEREVIGEYVRFLRALLDVSDETIHDIRFKDPANVKHMRHVPSKARELWEAETCSLPGTRDPEVMFRMGEDTRSCMGIRRACSRTNRALMGYLVQGNVRFVGVQSALGRMEARAVLRLLLRCDDMSAVLFMDEIYYSSHPDEALEEQAVLEAKSVSNTLDIPLYRAGDTIPRRASVKMIGSTSSPEGIRGGDGADQGNVKSSEVCELIEVDGLSRFVYSDGPVAPLDNAGMLEREPYPGSLRKRKLVIAELAYADADDTSKATPK